MAKVEFDNKKMWESVLSYTHCHKEIMKDHLLYALNDQGLVYKNGEIVCIKPKEEETIKAGNWYVCNCPIVNDNSMTAFHEGEIFYCSKDGWIDVNGALFKVGELCNNFRIATEEEILEYTKNIGTEYGFFKKQKEESKQESSDGRLTEFEETLKTIVNSFAQPIGHLSVDEMTDKGARNAAKTLLSIARKQIASEIDVDKMIAKYIKKDNLDDDTRPAWIKEVILNRYRHGIEDTLKVIKEK